MLICSFNLVKISHCEEFIFLKTEGQILAYAIHSRLQYLLFIYFDNQFVIFFPRKGKIVSLNFILTITLSQCVKSRSWVQIRPFLRRTKLSRGGRWSELGSASAGSVAAVPLRRHTPLFNNFEMRPSPSDIYRVDRFRHHRGSSPPCATGLAGAQRAGAAQAGTLRSPPLAV